MIIKLKIRKKTPKYKGLILISLLTSILTYTVNNSVRFYGDDFFYKRFTSGGFLYFLARHRQHYFLANGRVIVHLLATCFLGLSPILWRIANSLMLGGIVYFGARTASIGNKNGSASAGAIFAASLGFLNISVTRQSVYWLTGSFNYVYPLLMLLIYWWFLSAEGEKSRVLPVFAFLSAATTEQVSLMTFGLTILYFLENMVFGKSKRKMIYAVCLTASVAGMLSVLCAPSVLYRASIENAHGTGFALIKYNIRNQVIAFMFSGIMAPYHLMAMLSAIGTIISAQGVKLKNKNGVLFLSVSTFLFWLWQVLPGNTGSTAKAGRPALLLYFLTGLLYFASLVYAAFVRYLEDKNAAPFYALLLCFGSQIMMVVSPVYGPRNLLCAIIMLALYAGFMMPPLNRISIPAVFGVFLCFLLSL
ncbi:MAG: DUF6056 family protein, partial [Bacillota bacterium]|nr:DUF6056 family protein [Bacillota bacterium]